MSCIQYAGLRQRNLMCCPLRLCWRLHHQFGGFGAAQVQMVLEWTSAVGVDLLAGKPGPHGLTALHVAAVMENGASLAALLTGAPSAPPPSFPREASHVLASAQCF